MPIETRVVTDDEAEIRLDRWFRRHFPSLTQGAIQKFCRTGQVRVDGKRVEAAARLLPGQSVRVPPIPAAPEADPPRKIWVEPAEAEALRGAVIYRDDWVIVLNKPHGLPVQGGPGITKLLDGMLDVLRRVLNRIGRVRHPTTGKSVGKPRRRGRRIWSYRYVSVI